MLVYGGSGGGHCGCCCSYQAEGYNTALNAGFNNDARAGGCCASCVTGNYANQNANLSTAISRVVVGP